MKIKVNPLVVKRLKELIKANSASYIHGFTVMEDVDCPEGIVKFTFPGGREEVYKLEDLKG